MSGSGPSKGRGRGSRVAGETPSSGDGDRSRPSDLLAKQSVGGLVSALLGLAVGGLTASPTEAIRQLRAHRDPPNHPTRQEILDLLSDNPGLNPTELRDRLGVSRGTAQYHLRQLEDDDRIYSLSTGRERHHFPRGIPREIAEKLSAIRAGRAEDIALTVLDDPGLIQQELGDRVSMSRKVLRHNLDRLTEAGVIDEHTVGRARQYYPTEAFESLVGVFDEGRGPDGREPAPGVDGSDGGSGDDPTDVEH